MDSQVICWPLMPAWAQQGSSIHSSTCTEQEQYYAQHHVSKCARYEISIIALRFACWQRKANQQCSEETAHCTEVTTTCIAGGND